ncbi:hypothetical protein BCD48_01350 [Pseudofrankia sp. BMG5.36]|nr:hypothetical protein BCD48_01350 [Pseudofrankia sp. BMG5.36]
MAVLLTVGLFGLVIFGMGALFALFDHRVWGYVAGALACAVMVGAAVNGSRRSEGTGGPAGPGQRGDGRRPTAARRPAGPGRPGGAGGSGRSSGRAGGPGRPGGTGRPGRSGRR